MKQNTFLLINSQILPSVFEKVVYAKELLADGSAQNVTQAVKMAGISRSAFYKYKNEVFRFEDDNNTVSLSAVLSDKAGVFSAFTGVLYQNGANILTIHQDKPKNLKANVSITFRTDNVKISLEKLIEKLKKVDGIVSVVIL